MSQIIISSGFNKKSTAENVTEGVDLAGKTILVTGVASGSGLESLRIRLQEQTGFRVDK